MSDSNLTKPLQATTDLPDLLGEVILEQEGQVIFDTVEMLRQGFIAQRLDEDKSKRDALIKDIEKLDEHSLDSVIHAFSTFFHLANISEEHHNQQQRASLEQDGKYWSNSFADTIRSFKAGGKTLEQVIQLISELNYYPTFTAHPTEAKRPLVLEALQRIHSEYTLLMQDANTDSDLSEIRHRLKAMIQIFWKTETVRPQKPTVYDEIENSLFYFRESIFDSLPVIYRDLEAAIKQFYPEARGQALQLPSIVRFGTWVGGDRDGNPFVTPEITCNALRLQKIEALSEYSRRVDSLSEIFTHSYDQIKKPSALIESLKEDQFEQLNHLHIKHYKEPYRRKLSLIKLRLDATIALTQSNLSSSAPVEITQQHNNILLDPVSYTHLTLPTTPYV